MSAQYRLLIALVLLAVPALLPVHAAQQAAPDMTGYRTFAFVEGETKGVMADRQVRHRLQQIVTRQLMDKGYAPAAPGQAADLGVNIAGGLTDKQRVFVVGNPTPYDYYRGRIEAGGYDTEKYREGSVQVDLIDLKQARLVWNAQAKQTLSAGYSEENFKKVERALAAAFKPLPARR